MSDDLNIPLITTAAGLDEVIAHIRERGCFAFDTEFVSEDTFEPVLCLIQVATDERLAVIDPLPLRDLTPFWDAVNDPAIEVIMHAAGEDLRICRFQTGRVPAKVFDVQIVAGLVGFGYPLSLGNLANQTVRATLAGGETRTDWRRRPLSPGQLRYAIDDVRYLFSIADFLKNQLENLDREAWAEAELATFLSDIATRSDEERWRKLSGLHTLNRRGLEIARRLADWRYLDAKRTNRPLRQLLRDDLLVAIAKRQPTSKRDLEALRDFNRPHLIARSDEILELVAKSFEVAPEHLPEPAERHEEGPGLAMVISLLAATLSRCAVEHKIASAMLGTTNDLKELVRWHIDGEPADKLPRLLNAWRGEICGRTLLDVLAGRRSLRVVDPEADVPVALDPIT